MYSNHNIFAHEFARIGELFKLFYFNSHHSNIGFVIIENELFSSYRLRAVKFIYFY